MFQEINFRLISSNFFRKSLIILLLPLVCFIPPFVYSQNSAAQTAQEITVLEPSKPVERELSGGQSHDYQITLSANQYAKVTIAQRGIDVAAKLQTSESKISVDIDADPRTQGAETVEFTAKNESVFKLTIRPRQNDAPLGRYQIRIEEIRLASEQDYALNEARQLNSEATRLWKINRYDEALPLAIRALAIREKELQADNPDIGTSLTTLANLYNDKGAYSTAEPLYQRALSIKEKAFGKIDISLGAILNNMGNLYRNKGDYVKAESFFQRTLEIREKNLEPTHPLIAGVLNNLANVSRGRGDFDKAAAYYQRSLEIREKALGAEHPDVALSLNNIANLYSDVSKAEPLYKRALAIQEKVLGPDNPNVAQTLYNMAVLYSAAGDYAKALPICQRALAINEKALGAEHPVTSYALYLLAAIYHNNGDYVQAESLYQRTIAIKEKTQGEYHPDLSETYSDLAALYALKGETDKAVQAQSHANSISEFNTELNLTIGGEKQKLDYVESVKKIVDDTLTLNFQYASNSAAATNLGAEIILQRKGRVLDAVADNLSTLRRRLNAQDQLLLDNLDKVTEQTAELVTNGIQDETSTEYQSKIKTLTDEREKLEDEISRRAAGFYVKSQPVTSTAVEAMIPPDSALIEFAVYSPVSLTARVSGDGSGESRYVAYVLHHQGEIKAVDLGVTKQIDRAIDDFRQALRDPKRKDVQQLARIVDEKVMRPVRALLGDTTHLLISPDGELNLIPFEALFNEQGHYLVENYSFTYLTSGRDLLRMQTAHASNNKPLVIANPSFGEPPAEQIAKVTAGDKVNAGDKANLRRAKRRSVTAARDLSGVYFAPLSNTAQEARTIQVMFPEAVSLTGTKATKSALKQTVAPSILHIATHGFFLKDAEIGSDLNSQTAKQGFKTIVKNENPLLRSGLALAGANAHSNGAAGDDGILTALEATGLNLWGTKLVVLSACDTGLGEVKNGEGVYGLRRAFVLAGADSLLMSLWAVSDYTTRELMTSYYKNLKQGMGRGEALRAVQLEMLKKDGRQHPFYWGGFIQSGEWANLDGKRSANQLP